jgi:disease resistance protein
MTKDGKYYCGNPGCADQTYSPNENKEGACRYHAGQPVFHDRKKFWSCCKQEAYDWDDFMKLQPCVTGQHKPKFKN